MKPIQGTVTSELQEYIKQRDVVTNYIREQLQEAGAEKLEASLEVQCVKMWKINDVRNLYKCITSDYEPLVIKAIVSHDFNGLRSGDKHFVPKSMQFEEK